MFYWYSNQSGEVLGLAVAQARVLLHNAQSLFLCWRAASGRQRTQVSVFCSESLFTGGFEVPGPNSCSVSLRLA